MTWCFRFHAVRGSGQYPPFWTPGAVSGPHHFCIGPDWDIRGHSGLVVGGGRSATDSGSGPMTRTGRASSRTNASPPKGYQAMSAGGMIALRNACTTFARVSRPMDGRETQDKVVECNAQGGGADESRGSVTRVGGRSPAFGAKTPAPPPKPLALTMRHPGHRLPRILSPPSGHPPPPRTTATSHANTKEFMNEPRGFGRVRRGCPLGVRLAWAHCRRSLK